MKFTLSTKPFADALDLGVIPGNISKYFRVSCLAQVTADKHDLRINLQAVGICTEIILQGMGDEDEAKTAFVDCLTLKQIVGTFDASTTTIEFAEGGIVLHSGSSRCTLPSLADANDEALERPTLPTDDAVKVKLDLDCWKFIKDHQMYAIGLSFAHPIYTRVWVGESGDVVVGDFDNSLFTFSKKNKLGKTCLLKDTIINLFTSLPEGANITMMDGAYRVDVKTDGFEYAAEVTPEYEDDGATGSYKADLIMGSGEKTVDNSFQVAVAPLSKFLNQAGILSSESNAKVDLILDGTTLEVKDENVDVKIPVEGDCKNFNVSLDLDQVSSTVSHLDAEKISVCPILDEDDDSVSGLVIWTADLTVVIGAKDDEEA